jgi:hypothetical protein
MKTYRIDRKVRRTMTVGELKKKLDEYPDEMPVFGEWEGVHGIINPDGFETEWPTWWHEEDQCDCLRIDVEDY